MYESTKTLLAREFFNENSKTSNTVPVHTRRVRTTSGNRVKDKRSGPDAWITDTDTMRELRARRVLTSVVRLPGTTLYEASRRFPV